MKRLILVLTLFSVGATAQTGSGTAKAAGDKPQAESFNTYEDFMEALVEWRILQIARAEVTGPKLAALEISALHGKIAKLSADVETLDKRVTNQWSDIYDLKRETASFDPASPGKYTRIETSAGPLLVSLGTVEPYLDGYKVDLQIGNPLTVTFKEFTVSAEWAARYKSASNMTAWLKTTQSKTFSFTEELVSGRWNHATLIFPETKAENFGYLRVSVAVNTVSMAK